jgi:hypothetical protein
MISVILVNYLTARHTLDAVASVAAQQAIDKPEIIVVDNSVNDAEHALLNAQLPGEVTHIRNPENTRFAGACNLAFARSSGEFVLLLNPDYY